MVSIGRFNKVILLFDETFNKNVSLWLQYGFDFLLRDTIQVVISVKQKCLYFGSAQFRLSQSHQYLPILSNLAKNAASRDLSR